MSKFNLTEGLGYKDLAGMLKNTVYIDDFSSKMGDDDEIVVASFYVRDHQAAMDLVNWFEKGYDFIMDADMSPNFHPNFRRVSDTNLAQAPSFC